MRFQDVWFGSSSESALIKAFALKEHSMSEGLLIHLQSAHKPSLYWGTGWKYLTPSFPLAVNTAFLAVEPSAHRPVHSMRCYRISSTQPPFFDLKCPGLFCSCRVWSPSPLCFHLLSSHTDKRLSWTFTWMLIPRHKSHRHEDVKLRFIPLVRWRETILLFHVLRKTNRCCNNLILVNTH